MATEIQTESICQGSDVVYLARIRGLDAQFITQASLTSITLKVFKDSKASAKSPTLTEVVGISTSVFDTLQVDDFWTKDTTGYNFRHQVSGNAFPRGGLKYVLEYDFVPVIGGRFFLRFKTPTDIVLSLL